MSVTLLYSVLSGVFQLAGAALEVLVALAVVAVVPWAVWKSL